VISLQHADFKRLEDELIKRRRETHNDETDDDQRIEDERIRCTWSEALPQLRASAVERCISCDEYFNWIRFAYQLITDLERAVRSAGRRVRPKGSLVWTHQRFDVITAGDSKRGVEIDRDALIDTSSRYLGYTVRTDYLDWLLIDALLFADLDSFANSLMSGELYRAPNWAFVFADGNHWKYELYSALFPLLGFLVRYLLLPSIAIWMFLSGHTNIAASIAAIFGVYLVLRVISIPARISRWRLRKQHVKLLTEIYAAYSLAAPPVLNPARLKTAIDTTAAKGAMYPNPVLSLIDRLAKIHPDTCLPYSWPSVE
jgi:hypothetical protein